MKEKKFKIITPESGDDLIREGRILSHCVASYFRRVMNNQSKIYFMRKVETPKMPFVTIEVCGNKIHQVSGKSNRRPSDTEQKFIKEWAIEKKLANY